MVKFLYCSIGLTLVALGFVGAFLPLLPTTPFLLLALMCFAKGSDRLHNWLLAHRLLGKYLREWNNHRVIPMKAKLTATAMIGLSTIFVALTTSLTRPVITAIAAVMLIVILYIWRFPSSVKPSEQSTAASSVALH